MPLDLVFTGRNNKSGAIIRPTIGQRPEKPSGLIARKAAGVPNTKSGSFGLFIVTSVSTPSPKYVRPVRLSSSVCGPVKLRISLERRVDGLIWPRQFLGDRPASGILIPRD